jgi:hypothetical protein
MRMLVAVVIPTFHRGGRGWKAGFHVGGGQGSTSQYYNRITVTWRPSIGRSKTARQPKRCLGESITIKFYLGTELILLEVSEELMRSL